MSRHRSVRAGAAGVLLVALLAGTGACQRKPGATGSQAPVPDTAQQARVAEGQRAYLAHCAMCHGEWGLGDGPLAGEMRKDAHVTPAHLNDRARLAALGQAELIKVIERGGAHTGRSNLMPAWSERLPPEVIDRIAEFVMALPDLHREVPTETLAKFLEAPPGVPAEGRRLFLTLCSACHGPFGKGDGRYADTLWVRNRIRPRNLTDSVYFAGKTDRDLFTVISLGGGFFHKSPFMPVWGVSLTPQQINDLVSYVRALSRTGSPADSTKRGGT